MTKIGATLVALGLCAFCTQARAQTTTVTTTRGAFTQFVPSSETLVVRSETDPNPLQYVVTKQTTFVDQSGAPVAIDQIAPGAPLSIQYTTAGDRLIASRVVVQRPNVVERTTTTTTTTRPLTHDEKEAMEEAREHRKHQLKEQIEAREKALEKAKDALDDDDGD